MQDRIMCRHCNRWTFNGYYGFCGIGCCADFAHEHTLLFDEAKGDPKDDYIEELQMQVINAESEAEYYQNEVNEYYVYDEKCGKLEEENALLHEFKHAETALEVHREMKRIKEKYFGEREKVESLRERVARLEKVSKKLRKKNNALNEKYTRFEAMDFS